MSPIRRVLRGRYAEIVTSPRHRHRWARALTAGLAALAVGAALLAPAAATSPDESIEPGLYLVTFDDTPAAVYGGGIEGYPATAPERGERFDGTRPAVSHYRRLLQNRQDRMLARVGNLDPLYRYTTVTSGVAVRLTSEQVRELRTQPGVTSVERNTRVQLDNLDSPSFLELPGPGGAWARSGGPEAAGRGVVIGTIDSGLWPDNPSFAAPSLPQDRSPPALDGFTGGCQPGERWSVDDCNQKVVAARWFVEAFGADNIANAEYLSPRDAQGHGTHVASTAAGNLGVQTTMRGQTLEETSGMAPGAAVAAYKACWAAPNPKDDGCASADVLRALDQAVSDGVDVVSHPLSGPADGGTAMQEAFANATEAGVFVVTSAGNHGKRGVSPSSPWVLTAGATTYRLFQGAVVLGDGTRLVGANMSEQQVPDSPAVLASDIATPGGDRARAAQCLPGSIDASEARGTIVLCRRGVGARVDKSATVKNAGGVGMVLLNTGPGTLEADFHEVPTVHLGRAEGRTLRRHLESSGDDARVAINPAAEDGSEVPRLAGFSGRGPGADPDLVKPDVVAPGVSVLGAVPPVTGTGRDWDVLSGTSMAAAQVAGLAALIRGERPGWSPTAIKSAMMTTAYDVAAGPSGALAQGAGHVDPTRFLNPGLVYDASDSHDARSVSGVNTPSIAVDDLVGATTVRRTVTNVSGRAATYNATVSGVPGVDVSVLPATLRLAPGESRSFRVRFVATSRAQFDQFASGQLTWNDPDGHTVKMPLAVRAQRLQTRGEPHADGESGSMRLTGTGGMTGRVPVEVAGLAGATPATVDLTPGGAFDAARPAAGPSTHREVFEVHEDAAAARFDVATRSDGADFDLYVYRDGDLVASETADSPDERLTLLDPKPGRYEVYTHLHDSTGGAESESTFTGWVVSDEDSDNLRTPPSVQLTGNRPFSLEASWAGLDPGRRWFGLVRVGIGNSRHVTPVSVN